MFEARRSLTRREALVGGAALAGSVAAVGVAPTSADVSSWRAIRNQFALRHGRAHLDAFVFSSPPAPVRAAIARYRRALDAEATEYVLYNDDPLEARSRAAAAAYLRVPAHEVALTDSTTMGLGLLYGGLRLRPGQEILTTAHDFYSTHESLRYAADRNHAPLRFARLYDQPEAATRAGILSAVRRALSSRTRVLAITWVHSSSGVRLPVRDIADVVASANRGRRERDRILLCVDGVHGFAAEADDASSLGCDALVSGCHKWLAGPRGTGLIWAREEVWRTLTPTIPSFATRAFNAWFAGRTANLRRVPAGPLMTPGGYHSFEQRWALPEAFAFHERIGRQRIAARIHALAARFQAGARSIPRVQVRTPEDPALYGGIVCFQVRGLTNDAVVARLARHGVQTTVTPYATEYVRAGFPLPVLEADVDRALTALREVAARA